MDNSINLPKTLISHSQWLADNSTGQRATLSRADLSGADLSGADLSGANLGWATLGGANLSDVSGLIIAQDALQRLQSAAVAALLPGALDMTAWHTCKTTHCIGGTAIHQAGEVGRLLEAAVGSHVAALMLLGVEAHRHFYDSNEDAAEWLRSVAPPATGTPTEAPIQAELVD